MKYFTPDLFVRLQDPGDEQGFLAATRAWDQALDAYQAQLREVARESSGGIRRLARTGSLHDARLLGMWQGQSRLTIALKPEGEASRLLVLRYALIEAPYLNPSALPERYRSAQPLWLYDEMGIDRGWVFDSEAGVQLQPGDLALGAGGEQRGAVVFTHDILLSNGWEVRLRFHRLTLTRPSALLPAAEVPTRTGNSLSQSA